MPKYFAFASNARTFRDAVNAKIDSGPLETMFSTESVEIDQLDEDYPGKLSELFADHQAFKDTTYFYIYDDEGDEINLNNQ